MSGPLDDLVSELERRFPRDTIMLHREHGTWYVGVSSKTPGNRSRSKRLADAIYRLLQLDVRASS